MKSTYRIFNHFNSEYLFKDNLLHNPFTIDNREEYISISSMDLYLISNDENYQFYILHITKNQILIFGQSNAFIEFLWKSGVKQHEYQIKSLNYSKPDERTQLLECSLINDQTSFDLVIKSYNAIGFNNYGNYSEVRLIDSENGNKIIDQTSDILFPPLEKINLINVEESFSGEGDESSQPEKVYMYYLKRRNSDKKETSKKSKETINAIIIILILILIYFFLR